MIKTSIATVLAVLFSGSALAGEVVDSKIIDNGITFEKENGKSSWKVADEAQRKVTRETYSHAETAKNYRNWAVKGANQGLSHLRILAPRGKKAPTVQMNHDSLYSVAITKVVDGKVSFEIPESVDVYTSVQVIDQYGHGQHYVVEKGKHIVEVDTSDGTTHAFLIFRSGMEKGLEGGRANQDKLTPWGLVSGDFTVPNYDFDEVDAMTDKIRAGATGEAVTYTFPLNEKAVTDRDQWNLENALGWGGAPPIAYESNLYTNSPLVKGDKCMSTTFNNPESIYFSSITVYNMERFLFDDEKVKNFNSNWWEVNKDNTITISFNCGNDAMNNITTGGKDFTFTTRFYGVTPQVMQGNKAKAVMNNYNPVMKLVEGTPS